MSQHQGRKAPSRRASRKRASAEATRGTSRGCLPMAVVGIVSLVGLFFAGSYALDRINEFFGPAPDYSGAGTTKVTFRVDEGDSASAIGRKLKAAGIVKSVDAFLDAARGDERASGIQVGSYPMKKEMSAQSALSVLVDPDNLINNTVLVPEGGRVDDVVKTIARNTDITKKRARKALKDLDALGLPAEAEGNPEGWLFPATYDAPPGTTAKQLFREMIAQTVAIHEELNLAARARELGFSAEEIMTIASIAEYEVNTSDDFRKVARVIYNRLDDNMPLQMDSTVTYVSGKSGEIWTTAADREADDPYNTYKYAGLPPGPIGSPGKESLEAVLNPAKGELLYFVSDPETGETFFNETYEAHLADVAKVKE